MFFDTKNKNILYGLGVGISIVFEVFSNFPFQGGGLTLGAISNVLHILPVTLVYVSEDLMSVSLMAI
jgi:hypothetical protein